MKKLLLILLLAAGTQGLYAQSWAHPGAVWYFDFFGMYETGYVRIDYTGNTTINDTVCSILAKSCYVYDYLSGYTNYSTGNCFVAEINGRVLNYSNGKFNTMYDFNATAGSEWKVCYDFAGSDCDTGHVRVDSTGITIIHNDTLKTLYVSTVSGCMGWYSAKIVERIGCINDYIFPGYVSCIADAIEGGTLRCYSDNNFVQYESASSSGCDYIIGIQWVNGEQTVKIYSSGNEIVVDPESYLVPGRETEISMYSITGQHLFSCTANNSGTTEISTTEFPCGVYLLKVSNGVLPDFSVKIIK